MKLALIFSLFTLSVMVKCNLIAVAQPVILALGTIFTAINHQAETEKQHIQWRNIMPFTQKTTEVEEEPRIHGLETDKIHGLETDKIKGLETD